MNNIEINAKAIELRKRFDVDENSYVDIFSLASKIPYLSVMLYPMGERISGICIKNDKASIIAINSSMSYGRQRYSLAHEFYHLFYEDSGISISGKTFETNNENEKIANKFASYFLAPYNALRSLIQKIDLEKLSKKDVISLEQSFGISHQAILRRLVEDGFIKQNIAKKMEGNVLSCARKYGYDDKLYVSTDKAKEKKVYGNYIMQADKLKDLGIISTGKYEELLLEAFRYDIVYGEEGDEAIDD